MMNWIWAGLIALSLLFAVGRDIADLSRDTYRNGDAVPLSLSVAEDQAPDAGAWTGTVTFDPAAYAEHFGVAENELPDLEEAFEVTLIRADNAGGEGETENAEEGDEGNQDNQEAAKIEVRFAEGAALPEPLLTAATFRDEDGVLVGAIAATNVNPGATIDTTLAVAPVRFVNTNQLTGAGFDAAEVAAKLALGFIGTLALWMGLMKIAEEAGLVDKLVRLIRPALGLLFPEIPKDHPALGMIALNLSANVLGLGNAATPAGIKAMEELQKLNPTPDTATNSMCMFLAINTAGVQLLPPAGLVAVMGLATGQLWIPIIIVTGISMIIAITAANVFQRMAVFKRSDPMRPGNPANATSTERTAEEEGAQS